MDNHHFSYIKKLEKRKPKKKEALFPSVCVPRHLIYYTLAYYVVHYVPCSMHDSLERERERERERATNWNPAATKSL
jgi:translation initiation factor 2 beta subunit (eIF-2beta)/eIF-5